jgi:hypothetical protein
MFSCLHPDGDGRHHPLAGQLLQNTFRKLGFIDYSGDLESTSALLDILAHG